MDKITFKYHGNRPIEQLVSKELYKKIVYLQNSRIDDSPIYQTENSFDRYIMDILNNRDINSLKSLLRKNKIKKLIDYSESTMDIEFLNFWYLNSENLFVLLPM